MHLLFEALQRDNMWLSGTIKQTKAVEFEGPEAESGVGNPSGTWCN